jgi:hypothetical protein
MFLLRNLFIPLIIVSVIGFSKVGQGEEERCRKPMEFTFMPGDSHVISHRESASRDTALIAYQVIPKVAVTTGGDFGFFGFRFAPVELRLGMFGMFEFSTVEPDRINFLTVPSGPYVWRGLLGYSAALSLHQLAARLLSPGDALEISVGFRHESEHYIGDDSIDPSEFDGVPHIGDFILGDLAMRKGIGRFGLDIRIQNKFFIPTYDNYSFGPGGDLVLRMRALPFLFPFISVFGEYLFGKEPSDGTTVDDNYLFRFLAGIIFPGRTADLQIYFSGEYGNEKGILVYEKGFRYGWGIRVAPFKGGLF